MTSTRASRGSRLWNGMPFFTRFILVLCVTLFVIQFLFDEPVMEAVVMSPRNVIFLHQYWRIISSTLFHVNVMHIGTNSMSMLAIGGLLEEKMGTFAFAVTVCWGMILTSLVYIFTSLVAHVFGNDDLIYQKAVGFSGVLFHLSVLEAYQSKAQSRSIYGIISVPTKAYPWALLVAIQIMLPYVSFLGHLSGIIVGTLQLHGGLDVLLPSHEFYEQVQTWSFMRAVVESNAYRVVPPKDISINEHDRNSNMTSLVCAGLTSVIGLLLNIYETIKHICLGSRGNTGGEVEPTSSFV